jgi:succinate dehydrogenase hydrophobic anchor subunit
VGGQDELGKLRTQLALCERLLVRRIESGMRQAIEDYASELEARLWLLLIKAAALPASPW